MTAIPPPLPPEPTPPPPVGAAEPSAPPPPPDVRVSVQGVSKRFGSLVAVSDVSFGLGPGVTALLGPNGAGKSTLIRLLCGLTAPTTGVVRVEGGDPRRDHVSRAKLGLVPQQDGVFELDTVLEFVRFGAELAGLTDPDAAARRALARVELPPELERPIGAFSKGMRQRAKIASALVHDPTVLVLDEPLNGLDPKQRRQMIELFRELGEEGRTVLVSSHVLDEVERFGSRVLVIAKGRLAAEGDFRAIRSLMDDQPLRFRVSCGHPHAFGARLLETGLVSSVEIDGGELMITTERAPEVRRAVARVAADLPTRLDEFVPLDDDLEAVFRYLVG